MHFYTFNQAFSHYKHALSQTPLINRGRWQSTDVSDNQHADMHELLFEYMHIDQVPSSLKALRQDLIPAGCNVSWADDHFMKERVGGQPLNPGDEWKNWPWAKHADNHRTVGSKLFSHTYAERFWPLFAGRTFEGRIPRESLYHHRPEAEANMGIRYRYGDLTDVIYQLVRDPYTRQAIIPIFFPEDTGAAHNERVPCTIAYQLIREEDKLHGFYFIRSCDLIRHWADDCYMAVRLFSWILEEVKNIDPATWSNVSLGQYHMMMTNLHCFKGDL